MRLRGGQRKGGWQAGDTGAQVDIGIEAERRFWGLAALELNGVKLMAKLKKKKARVRQALRLMQRDGGCAQYPIRVLGMAVG